MYIFLFVEINVWVNTLLDSSNVYSNNFGYSSLTGVSYLDLHHIL